MLVGKNRAGKLLGVMALALGLTIAAQAVEDCSTFDEWGDPLMEIAGTAIADTIELMGLHNHPLLDHLDLEDYFLWDLNRDGILDNLQLELLARILCLPTNIDFASIGPVGPVQVAFYRNLELYGEYVDLYNLKKEAGLEAIGNVQVLVDVANAMLDSGSALLDAPMEQGDIDTYNLSEVWLGDTLRYMADSMLRVANRIILHEENIDDVEAVIDNPATGQLAAGYMGMESGVIARIKSHPRYKRIEQALDLNNADWGAILTTLGVTDPPDYMDLAEALKAISDSLGITEENLSPEGNLAVYVDKFGNDLLLADSLGGYLVGNDKDLVDGMSPEDIIEEIILQGGEEFTPPTGQVVINADEACTNDPEVTLTISNVQDFNGGAKVVIRFTPEEVAWGVEENIPAGLTVTNIFGPVPAVEYDVLGFSPDYDNTLGLWNSIDRKITWWNYEDNGTEEIVMGYTVAGIAGTYILAGQYIDFKDEFVELPPEEWEDAYIDITGDTNVEVPGVSPSGPIDPGSAAVRTIASGVPDMRVRNNGNPWTDWMPVTDTLPWTLADATDGLKTVYIQFRDAWGYVSDLDSLAVDTIYLARDENLVVVEPPVGVVQCGATLAAGELTGGTVMVGLTEIPGTFEWTNPAAEVTSIAEGQQFGVTFVAAYECYGSTTDTITVTVVPGTTPSLVIPPTASAINDGQPLSASALNVAGAVVEFLDVPVSGTWTFTNDAIIPDPFEYSASVTFTPDDACYDAITSNVTVLVYNAVDTNKDGRIVMFEAIRGVYLWQTTENLAMAEAIRGIYIWQRGEVYEFNDSFARPLWWVPSNWVKSLGAAEVGVGAAVLALNDAGAELRIEPMAGTTVWGAEVAIPDGVTITSVYGDNAVVDAANGKITWYAMGDDAAVVGFTGEGADSALKATVCFDGANLEARALFVGAGEDPDSDVSSDDDDTDGDADADADADDADEADDAEIIIDGDADSDDDSNDDNAAEDARPRCGGKCNLLQTLKQHLSDLLLVSLAMAGLIGWRKTAG